MSKILVPYINHKSINHKFYLRFNKGDGTFQSTCYWTSLYPEISVNDRYVCSQLADKLLCYDTCIISVDDYLFLVGVLGYDVMEALIKEGALEIFNNGGLRAAIASMASGEPLILNFSLENEVDPEIKVAEYQRVYGVLYGLENIKDISKQIYNSRKLDLSDSWFKTLNKETLNDLDNHNIIDGLGLINGGKIFDRDQDYNQFLYNRIAYLNLFMAIGNLMSLDNILLPFEIQRLLNLKLGAYVNRDKSDLYHGFTAIAEYAGICDISKLLVDGVLNFYDILRIRNNKNAIAFRVWLEGISSKISGTEAHEYVDLYNRTVLKGIKLKDRENIISKVLKFSIPTSLGLIPNGIAQVASIVIGTSLFVGDFISGKYKPNVFIEDFLKGEIGKKMSENMWREENKYYIYKYGKIPPNNECPCRSGLKYKKCHGLYN